MEQDTYEFVNSMVVMHFPIVRCSKHLAWQRKWMKMLAISRTDGAPKVGP